MTCVQGVLPGTAAPNAPAGAECRVWQRDACGLPTACQPLAARSDSEMQWRGEMRDISVGGAGLVLERRFEPGTVLTVAVTGDPSRAGKPLLARVVHVRALGGRRWLLGCAFLSRLSTDQLQSLLHPEPPAAAQANGRASAAAAPAPAVILGVHFEGQGPGDRGLAFSVRRLHVRRGWPPPEGATLLLRLSDNEPVRIRIRVRCCAPRGGRWVVGYDFVEPPSPAALRLLGSPRRAAAPAGR
jgi:hypothetical protein